MTVNKILKALLICMAAVVFLANEAKAEIIKTSGSEDVHVLFCDLASFDSIKGFCAEFESRYDRLDVLLTRFVGQPQGSHSS